MSNKEENGRLPLLANGEQLIGPVDPIRRPMDKKYPRTYEEARFLLKQNISKLEAAIMNIPNTKRMHEVVMTVRLNSAFLAKSFTPVAFFRDIQVQNIGSRRWMYSSEQNQMQYSKMHFVKGEPETLRYLNRILDLKESSLSESFVNDVRKIEEFSLLSQDERVLGFDEEWAKGIVEMVLHPFGEDSRNALNKLLRLLYEQGVKEQDVRVKLYPDGPVFLSVLLNQVALNSISDFNPLRTVHPLRFQTFPEIRTLGETANAPLPPSGTFRSTVKVGMFDGGVQANHPLLEQYVNQNHVLATPSHPDLISHGTGVAGAILYGALNEYDAKTQLPTPAVNVESFRVLPLSDPFDHELYEIIDLIENVVPEREDIRVYNLSLGPRGPILDDDISRFTYALDRLAWDCKKLFVVAVGNDGDLEKPYNRIQAPADIVNGLGIGAYSIDVRSGDVKRAFYSCVGEGREGCKVKPDLMAFGGDDNHPIHLVSTTIGHKSLSMGTSFASPIIAGKAGEILGRCDRFNPLIARALMIHSAKHPSRVDHELGYGVLDQSVDEILTCTDNRVTLIYSSSMLPASRAKLPIPYPDVQAGKIEFYWTIAVLSNVDHLHVEDYTFSSIEDTFYPHDLIYRFSRGKTEGKVLHIIDDADEISNLTSEGWKRSKLPASKSSAKYKTEQSRRNELKWDTVVKRWVRMNPSSIRNPFLVLHGQSRNGSHERLNYAVIVTMDAPKYKGSLYEDILAQNRQLEPIHLRSRNEILVPI